MNSLIQPLIGIEFGWGGRLEKHGFCDCLGLAIEARARLLTLAKPLPDYSRIYEQHTRYGLPPRLVADLIKSNDRAVEVDDPFIGDLVLIWGPRGAALGTVASVVGGVPMILAFDEDERSGLFQPAELSILGYWRVD